MFDHFTWLCRSGFLHPKLESKTAYASAAGESLLYVASIALDVILIKRSLVAEHRILARLHELESELSSGRPLDGTDAKAMDRLTNELQALRNARFMRVLAIAASCGDLVISFDAIRPGTVCGHPLMLCLGGFTSAISGTYRLWPR